MPAPRPRRHFADATPQDQMAANKLVKKLEAEIVRTAILKDGKRIDGRTTSQIRPIEAVVGFLPRTHGSALFTRGETQAICTTTLGTKESEQMIDGPDRPLLRAFPAPLQLPALFRSAKSAASARRRAATSATASWHGAHCTAVLPTHDEFPYTIRVLSDITESNGSSSMATVCGGSLAMMDAGVPLKRPVSGIAMGLILEGKDFACSATSSARGPSGRHGFQGRRHQRGHHLAADGHQDRRNNRGDHEDRARPGE